MPIEIISCINRIKKFYTITNLAVFLSLLSPFIVNSAEIVVAGDKILVTGEIASGDGDVFLDRIEDDTKVLEINSQGGDALAGMQIARAVMTRNLSLRVVDFCASACASLILPASKEIYVKDGSIIAIHAGEVGLWRAAINSNSLPKSVTDQLSMIEYLFEFEKSLNKHKFFKRQDEITGVKNADITVKIEPDRRITISGKNIKYRRYEYWTPSHEELIDLGINVSPW
ncbi:hypothetical protein ACG0Z6_04910 [Roseateles sp. BYS180W]|uniref:Clp protease n=1 Tax=Roseateles rivi TaxID=3299028 RepID=A0ABW7FTJ3_9BURK